MRLLLITVASWTSTKYAENTAVQYSGYYRKPSLQNDIKTQTVHFSESFKPLKLLKSVYKW